MSAKRVLLDDVYMAISSGGIARVWESFIRTSLDLGLFDRYELEPVLLDRSGCLSDVDAEIVTFPEYDFRYPAQDRLLMSSMAADLRVDISLSSYYTFTTVVPSCMLVYDMIPELMGFDTSNRGWLERKLAILHSSGFCCISDFTRDSLFEFYPHSRSLPVNRAHPGVDQTVFHARGPVEIAEMKAQLDLSDNYLVMVGNRYQTGGYKNGGLVVDALSHGVLGDADLVFVGGEEVTDEERSAAAHAGVRIVRVECDDSELAALMSGSMALLYPSLLEGFGLPPLEALACGTPVICTDRGSLPEAVGTEAIFISGRDALELGQSLAVARAEAVRGQLAVSGPRHAARFTWAGFCESVLETVATTVDAGSSASSRFRSDLIKGHDHLVARLQC